MTTPPSINKLAELRTGSPQSNVQGSVKTTTRVLEVLERSST